MAFPGRGCGGLWCDLLLQKRQELVKTYTSRYFVSGIRLILLRARLDAFWRLQSGRALFRHHFAELGQALGLRAVVVDEWGSLDLRHGHEVGLHVFLGVGLLVEMILDLWVLVV